jgi:hypothetical protein
VNSHNANNKQIKITNPQYNNINNLQERLLKTEKLVESLNNKITEQ